MRTAALIVIAIGVLTVLAIILPLLVRSDMPSEANLDNLIFKYTLVGHTDPDTVDIGMAQRAQIRYENELFSIPGVNKVGLTICQEHGNWVIGVGFETGEQRYNMAAQGFVPSSLDGVPVQVDPKYGKIVAE